MLIGRYRAGRRLRHGRRSIIASAMIVAAVLAAVALPGRMDAFSIEPSPAPGAGGDVLPSTEDEADPTREPDQPYVFDTPPPGGLAMGVANTNDIHALIDAQPFDVKLIAALDAANQQWLLHIVGAPSLANTLTSETLSPNMIVVVRRSEPESSAVDGVTAPHVNESPGGTARITYYYCERGSTAAGWGDGGGFCGHMRSGEVVYPGAASCSSANLGQRFRIVGDPTGRTYTCEDTGGGVMGNHRDIWFRNSDEAMRWYAAVGTHAEIVIVD